MTFINYFAEILIYLNVERLHEGLGHLPVTLLITEP